MATLRLPRIPEETALPTGVWEDEHEDVPEPTAEEVALAKVALSLIEEEASNTPRRLATTTEDNVSPDGSSTSESDEDEWGDDPTGRFLRDVDSAHKDEACQARGARRRHTLCGLPRRKARTSPKRASRKSDIFVSRDAENDLFVALDPGNNTPPRRNKQQQQRSPVTIVTIEVDTLYDDTVETQDQPDQLTKVRSLHRRLRHARGSCFGYNVADTDYSSYAIDCVHTSDETDAGFGFCSTCTVQ